MQTLACRKVVGIERNFKSVEMKNQENEKTFHLNLPFCCCCCCPLDFIILAFVGCRKFLLPNSKDLKVAEKTEFLLAVKLSQLSSLAVMRLTDARQMSEHLLG